MIRKFVIGIFIFVASLIFQTQVFAASDVIITPAGSSYKSGNFTMQDILVSIKGKKNWKLIVTPQDNALRNSSHQISLDRMSIQDNDSSDIYNFESVKPVVIASGNSNDNINKNISLKLSNSDADYPGNYYCNFLFTLTSSTGTDMESVNFSFTQPKIQEISITPNILNIDVQPEKSMLNNYSQESDHPVRIYVRSNKEWRLSLNGVDRDNTLNYAFKVLSGTNVSNLFYNSEYTDLSNSSFIVAEGNPTVSADKTSIESSVIELNYRLKTADANTLTAGVYPYNVVYNLALR